MTQFTLIGTEMANHMGVEKKDTKFFPSTYPLKY